MPREGSEAFPEFVVQVLQRTGLDVPTLARLLNVKPETVDVWIAGKEPLMGCVYVLLNLLWDHPEQMVNLLRERARTAGESRPPWTERIRRVRENLGLTRQDLADILQAMRYTIDQYENGSTEPSACHAVFIDLLHDHADPMVRLLGWKLVDEEYRWPRRRILGLMAKVGMTTARFADFIGAQPTAVYNWLEGIRQPSYCVALLMELLDIETSYVLWMIRNSEFETHEAWTGDRIKAARKRLDLTQKDMMALLNLSASGYKRLEAEGLPEVMRCPIVLFTLLEKYPEKMKSFLVRIAQSWT